MFLFVTFVKYLSVFVLKNPAGISSEFWSIFLNIFAISISVITQTVFAILPGRNPISFYICSGEDPRLLQQNIEKKNVTLNGSILLTFIAYVFVFVSVKIFQRKIFATTFPQGNQENQTLANLGTIALALTTFLPMVFLYTVTNQMSIDKLGTYPYFLIIRFFNHGLALFWNSARILIFVSKSKTVRATILREISDRALGIREKLCG